MVIDVEASERARSEDSMGRGYVNGERMDFGLRIMKLLHPGRLHKSGVIDERKLEGGNRTALKTRPSVALSTVNESWEGSWRWRVRGKRVITERATKLT